MTTSVQKHFELTSESKVDSFGGTLFRVRLTIDCKWGKAGDLGGWVRKDENIQGFAWVSDNARVYGNARISDNARIYGDAQVSDNAWIYGDAQVSDNARVSGNAQVSGNAWVYGDAQISGNAWVSDNAWIYGNARVYDNAWIYGDARVSGNAQVYGDAWGTSPLQIQGSRHTLTECKKGFLQIGCKVYTFEEWELHFEAIGKAEGYSENQIQEYKLYIDLAVNLRSLRYGNEKI